MLGSGLGKKVDAKFVKDEYQEFLGQKVAPAKKKPMTKQEKRAEARQKGYFIVAEDEDRTPTVIEKAAVPQKPYVCKDVPKPTKWKKTKRDRSQDTASEDGEDKTEHRSKKSKKSKPGSTLSKGQKGHRKKETQANESKSDTAPRRTPKAKKEKEPNSFPKMDSSERPSAARKAATPVTETPLPDQHYEADPAEPVIVEKSQPSPTKAVSSELPTGQEIPVTTAAITPVNLEIPEAVTATPTPPDASAVPVFESSAEPVAEPVAAPAAEPAALKGSPSRSEGSTGNPEGSSPGKAEGSPGKPDGSPEKAEGSPGKAEGSPGKAEGSPGKAERLPVTTPEGINQNKDCDNKASDNVATAKGSDSSVHSDQFTLRSPSEPALTPKDDVFGKMDDEEFDKVLEQEHKNLAVSDKKAVEAARRILKAAHREKAFEKVLTKEENEILARFFAGKIPYDKQVLSTLDSALDKTIDFLRTHNVQMDPETKSLIDKRGSAKAALFEAILSSPSLIPTSWSKKYVELLEESKKETEGINWARVLLCYPPQKSLYDGPEDQFGNFTRRRRHWLLGCLLGPADSKSFEETRREETCKGMYMDTALIEKAKETAPASQMGEPTAKKQA